jgi:hypothetical protein
MTHEEFQPQSDPAQSRPEADDLNRGFQVEFIPSKTVLAWVLALLGLGLVAVTVCFSLWAWLSERTPKPEPITSEQITPLDPHQRETRMQFENEQEQILNSYGWVDEERDIVHVPIERAKELLIERTNP